MQPTNRPLLVIISAMLAATIGLTGCEVPGMPGSQDTQHSDPSPKDGTGNGSNGGDNGISLGVLGVANAEVKNVSVAGRFSVVDLSYSRSTPKTLVAIKDLPSNATNVTFFKPHVSGVQGRYAECPRIEATHAVYSGAGDLESVRGMMGSFNSLRVIVAKTEDLLGGGQFMIFPENQETSMQIETEGRVFVSINQYDPVTQVDYYTISTKQTVTLGDYAKRQVLAVDLTLLVTGIDGKPLSGLKPGNFRINTSTWCTVESATETEAGQYLVRGILETENSSQFNQLLSVSIRNMPGSGLVPLPR